MMLVAGGVIAVQSQINGELADELGTGPAPASPQRSSASEAVLVVAAIMMSLPSGRPGSGG